MIEIHKGSQENLEAFLVLLKTVWDAMEHKEWFCLDSPEEVRERMCDGTMELWVAMDGERLVGALSVLRPGLEAFNYGYIIGIPEEKLVRVIHMDTAVVHPDYRGLGIQRRLMQLAEEALAATRECILLCTVHPDNPYSLKNVLSQGYQIQKTVPLYGSIRHILRKNVG